MDDRKPRRLDSAGLWAYALKVLSGRAHSTGELREKLGRRAAVPGDVESILARLKDHGYLNDRRYAPGQRASGRSARRAGFAPPPRGAGARGNHRPRGLSRRG
jgi:SOS response regulatory protein OraA/RecX